MQNFSIGVQIKNELNDFNTKKVKLASTKLEESGVRVLKENSKGYYFNQRETIALTDLYYNSQFESGQLDEAGKLKMFMNIGKFRTDVASKQIDIDTKDFTFTPDPYADPWTAYFLQKDFHEWAKDSVLDALINECVDALPKYGTVVLKKVGQELSFTPLQNLKNEQTAKSLKTAKYVIEEHPDMSLWEMQDMKGWETKDLSMQWDETLTVYERYGRVPLAWLKKHNGEEIMEGDERRSVDALVIAAFTKDAKGKENGVHVFFAEQITDRPYRECHWSRQHGRWLGIGVMEDLFQNQKAKNIIINLIRKSMQWSAKRGFQSANTDLAGKSLVDDFRDGEIVEVGMNGEIREIPMSAKTNADFQVFLSEFERNSDQKAFTYEVATGEGLPGGTPFRLGVILSNAVNSYYALKREKLGIFLKEAVSDFMIPQFLKDMDNEDKVLALFSDEPGYEVIKAAAMDYVKSEACRISLLAGQGVDANTIAAAIQPYEAVNVFFKSKKKGDYKTAKYKFDFTITGENNDLEKKLQSLSTLYQIWSSQGDSRAEAVLARMAALGGESISAFGPKAPPAANPAQPTPTAQPSPYQPQPETTVPQQ